MWNNSVFPIRKSLFSWEKKKLCYKTSLKTCGNTRPMLDIWIIFYASVMFPVLSPVCQLSMYLRKYLNLCFGPPECKLRKDLCETLHTAGSYSSSWCFMQYHVGRHLSCDAEKCGEVFNKMMELVIFDGLFLSELFWYNISLGVNCYFN